MAQDKIFCPNCGKPNEISNSFCEYCGQDLRAYQAQIVSDDSAPKLQDLTDQKAELEHQAELDCQTERNDELQQKETKRQVELQKQAEAKEQETAEVQRQNAYTEAMNLFSGGQLEAAAKIFFQLGNYREAPEKLAMIQKILSNQVKSKSQGVTAEDVESRSAKHSTHGKRTNAIPSGTTQVRDMEMQRAYESGIAGAEKANTPEELHRAIVYLQQLGNYQDLPIRLKDYQDRYEMMVINQQKIRTQGRNKLKKILLAVAGFVVVTGAGFGWWYVNQQNAKELASAVTKQRAENSESYKNLPGDVQEQLKTLLVNYQGNVKDYTYQITGTTSDYTMVSYTFKGPDKSKDVLPTEGTRVLPVDENLGDALPLTVTRKK